MDGNSLLVIPIVCGLIAISILASYSGELGMCDDVHFTEFNPFFSQVLENGMVKYSRAIKIWHSIKTNDFA